VKGEYCATFRRFAEMAKKKINLYRPLSGRLMCSSGRHAMTLTFQSRRASEADLPSVAQLFDGYRQFYGQPADYPLAEAFLRDRFAKNDSAVFLATEPQSGEGLGFVQLYPSFSSVAAQRIWILNDLFVVPAARRRGVGRALLETARDFAVSTGAKRLVLSTATTNAEACALYESSGYKEEDVFLVYKLELQ
jgi:GNAT superfamily N-acetyltransferase